MHFTLASFFSRNPAALLWVAALALAAGLAACAAEQPGPPSRELRAGLGMVGVISHAAPPAITIIPVPKGKVEGAANGAGAAVVSTVNGCLEYDPTFICALGALVLSPYLALGGAIYGVSAAKGEGEVRAAEQAIAAALDAASDEGGEFRRGSLAERVAQTAREAHIAARLIEPGTSLPGGAAGEETAPADGGGARGDSGEGAFDTILEVRVLSVRLGKRPVVNPRLYLLIEARARLVTRRGHAELYRRTFSYRSAAPMRFTAWAAHRARALRAALEAGNEHLAKRMVAVLFTEQPGSGGGAEPEGQSFAAGLEGRPLAAEFEGRPVAAVAR